MALTRDAPIRGATSKLATVAAAMRYVDSRTDLTPRLPINRVRILAYLFELHDLCVQSNIRFEIAFAQACDETNVFRSTFWEQYTNPVGFGAEETLERLGQINYVGGSWTPVGAARVHLHHLSLYTYGYWMPKVIQQYQALNFRLTKVAAAGYVGKAPTIQGLAGRWAANLSYADQIAAHANRAFPGLNNTPDVGTEVEMAPTIYDIRNDAHAARFGLSPWERDYLLGRCMWNRNGAKPKAIVCHIQDGVSWGSLDWWVNGRDQYGNPIQASSTVLVQKDGSILKVIPEEHGPWTNGDVNQPTAASAGLRALGGNPNNWSLTIEAEGRPWDVMPQVQVDAIVWQCQDWMRRYAIGLDMVDTHSSINSVSRANCPGQYFARVYAALSAAPVVPTYVKPFPPPAFDGTDKDINGVTFHALKRVFTSVGVNSRLWAKLDAPKTRPMIPAGEKIYTYYWIEGEDIDGNNRWLVGQGGSRIWSGGVHETF